MNRRTIGFFPASIVIAGFIVSGACAVFKSPDIAPPVFSRDLAVLAPEDFAPMIQELEEISQTHKSPSIRARACYYAALLHMHQANPSRSIPKSLDMLDQYLSIETELPPKRETEIWKAVLVALDRVGQEKQELEADYDRLMGERDKLEKENTSLNRRLEELSASLADKDKELRSLEEKIKKLDALYIQIEKKKKKK